jgi:hypothetical protein
MARLVLAISAALVWGQLDLKLTLAQQLLLASVGARRHTDRQGGTPCLTRPRPRAQGRHGVLMATLSVQAISAALLWHKQDGRPTHAQVIHTSMVAAAPESQRPTRHRIRIIHIRRRSHIAHLRRHRGRQCSAITTQRALTGQIIAQPTHAARVCQRATGRRTRATLPQLVSVAARPRI